MNRPYICGPMTGCANNNYDRFAYLLRALRDIGLDPQSPHLLEANIPLTTKENMADGAIYRMVIPGDIYMLSTCDSAIALPGWQDSNGTRFELSAAALFQQRSMLPNNSWHFAAGKDGITDPFKRWVDGTIERIQKESQ